MAIYQFLSHAGQWALGAGAALGGYKAIRAATKAIQLDRIRLDVRIPKTLKFSLLEINLTTKK